MRQVQTNAPAQAGATAKAAGSLSQRRCACGTHTIGGAECDGCRGGADKLQSVPDRTETSVARPIARAHSSRAHGLNQDLSRIPLHSNIPPRVQLKPVGNVLHESVRNGVSPAVPGVLNSSGQPLDLMTQRLMESRFNQDFGNVRVHNNAAAGAAAASLDARAFTSGRSIVFGVGEYAPQTDSGRRLIAHELAHVVQQKSGVPLSGEVGSANDSYERLADNAAEEVMTGLKPATLTDGAPAGFAPKIIQRQEKPGDKRTAANSRPKTDVNLQVAKFKARLAFLMTKHLSDAYQSVKLSRIPGVPDASQRLHEALAFAFIKHNPGSSIKYMNKDAVGIDTSNIPKWKKKASDEEHSVGTALATDYPGYKKFFITGPGTLWLTRAGVEASPSDYREFLWRVGGVPESELAELMDSMYKQVAGNVGEWIKNWDSEAEGVKTHEAPLVMQFVADVNPLMAVAKVISIIKDDKALYALPGTNATTLDKVEAGVGLLALGESIFGDILKLAVKGAQAAKVVDVARKVANPLGHISEAVVETWAEDEVIRTILASILEWQYDKVVWDGIIHPLGKLGGGEQGKEKTKGKSIKG
jgi:hypothetical protein